MQPTKILVRQPILGKVAEVLIDQH